MIRFGRNERYALPRITAMNRLLFSALALVTVVGCAAPPNPIQTKDARPSPQAPATPTSSNASPSGAGGGIAPMAPNTGGITPVAGTDSVEGAGGGSVGIAAKNAAKKAASQSSMPEGAGDDGQ